MSYFIAYVDKEEDERKKFVAEFDSEENEFEIESIDPEENPNVEEMVEYLLQLGVDALITDFDLTKGGKVNYTSNDLIDQLRRYRPEFPCFIQTADEHKAIKVSSDVNMVYTKDHTVDEPNSKSEKRPRPIDPQRVKYQIESYRSRIQRWQDELHNLLEIPIEQRTAAQIDRFLELDHNLEYAFCGELTIPKSVKEDLFKGNGKREELLDVAERLVIDIRKELDDSK